MKTANVGSLGALPSFTVSTSAGNYWQERAAYEYSLLNYNLSQAGIQVQVPETSDFSTFGAGVQDNLDNYIDRYEDILQTGFSSVVAAIPDVLPIMSAVLSGGGDAVISILLQGVLDTILRHKDTRADHYNGDSFETDVSEIVTALEAISDKMDAVLTEFNINVLSSGEDSFFSAGPPVD